MADENVPAAKNEAKLTQFDDMMFQALLDTIDNAVRGGKYCPDRHATERFVMPATAWLSFRSTQRQERLTSLMHKQSRAIMVLTAVVVVVAMLQVVLLVVQIVRG